MSDLLTRMSNAVTRADIAATTTFNVLTGSENEDVLVLGEPVPTLAKRMKQYLDALAGAGSLNGEDGVGIESMEVDLNGHLQVQLTGQPAPVDLGLVRPVDGVGIETAELNELGELMITLTDTTTFNLGNVNGSDAPTIQNAYIEGGNLKVETSDGMIFNAGDITQFGGISVNYVDLTEAGEFVVIFSDGTITNLGTVVGERGLPGRSIISGYINGAGDLVFLRNDGQQINVGKVNVKVPDANSVIVEGARLGGLNNEELILTLSTGDVNVGKIVGAPGEDGSGVATISLDEEGMLTFNMTDGETHKVGPIVNVGVGENASMFLTNVSINEQGELLLDVDVNGEIQSFNAGNVVGVDGTDGYNLDAAAIDPVTSELKFSEAGVEKINAGVVEQISISSASIDPSTGHLIITLSNDQVIDCGSDIRGINGIDGIGVTGAYIDVNGHLWFTFDGAPDGDAGKVTAPIETDVTFVDNQLTITLSDGQTFGPYAIGGSDGVYMTDAAIVNGELIIQLSNDTEINAGVIDKNPTTASVEAGKLRVTFNDDSFIETTARVQGLDGDTITGASIDQETHELVFNLTTGNGTETSELRVPSVEGRSITNIYIDAGDVVIENDVTVEPLRVAIPKGVDGNTITSIEFVGNDLNIITSDAPETPVVIPAVKGDTINSVSVVGDDLVFDVSTQEEPIVFPTIRGVDAVESIESIVYVQETNQIVITKVDQSQIVIENARGVDGVSIERIYMGLNDEFNIETSDGGLYTLPFIYGRDGDTVDSLTLNDSNGLDVVYTVDGVPYTVTIPAVHGVDGIDAATVQSAEMVAGDLVFTMSDETTHTVTGIGHSVTAVSVTPEGKLKVTLSDASELVTTESIIGRDGHGTGVSNVQYIDGSLQVTLTDVGGTTSRVDAGDVTVVTITNAEVVAGELVLHFSDGRVPVNVGQIVGNDGRHVTGASIDENQHLILNMNNGDTIDAGSARGKNGRSVTSIEILATNELIVNYDDETVQVVGNIGGSDDLTVWESQIPYAKDRVVIHRGTLYLSLVNNNSAQPPHANWRPIAFGDYMVEIRKPVAISPIDGESGLSKRPQLKMSEYAPLVSSDALDYREIQVYVSTPTTLAYTTQHSSKGSPNTHEVGVDLNINTTYKWRFRDVALNGVISEWSDEQTFVVPENAIATPTLMLDEDENANAAFAAPQFHTGAFDDASGQTHASTDWVVEDELGEVVWQSLADTVNKLSVIVPFGVLQPSTMYKVRAKHNGNTKASGWSDYVTITTEAVFDYIETPVVIYDGDPLQIDSFPRFDGSAFRKSSRFLPISANVSTSLASADWEIYNADTGVLHEAQNKEINSLELAATVEFQNSVNYRVRVRYNSDRFGVSEWSQWFEGSSVVTIDTPVLSTTEDVLAFPVGGTVTASPFVAINEEHINTDWEVRLVSTDEILLSYSEDGARLTSLDVYNPIGSELSDIKIRCRYNGVNISTPWSEFLNVHTVGAYTGPGPQTLLAGDMNDGFFGEVTAAELFTHSEIESLSGMTSGVPRGAPDDSFWLKFAIDRKILYVQSQHVRRCSYIDLPAGVRNETQILEKDGYRFKNRLIDGTGPEKRATGDKTPPYPNSEWNRLMYRVDARIPLVDTYGGKQIGENWVEYTPKEIDIIGGYTYATICMHSGAADSSPVVIRGNSGLHSVVVDGYHITHGTDLTSNVFFAWRPVLELIIP